MNVADSRHVATALEGLGYAPVDRAEAADVVVLNTCVVRQQAEDKIYGRLGSLKPLKAQRPDAVIAVMGCLVGIRDPEPLRKRFPWVDVFLPPSEPGPLLDLLVARGAADEDRAWAASQLARRHDIPAAHLLPVQQRGELVAANVPIVLGCSHACAYCVIPYRRGAERSRDPDEILAEVRALAAQGVREVTLLGQIVDRYGTDLYPDAQPPTTPLVDLLRQVHQVEGLERIRFLTSHPNWMRDDLLAAVAELPKVCEHIEVPVQAGDDEVLARMRRGYTADDYRRLITRVRERIPGVAITTDIIVGFPGETRPQFQRTVELLAELKLDKAHIARYSPRPQTLATRRYPDDVPWEEKERRRKVLDDLQEEIVSRINRRYLDQVVEVLVEGRKKDRWRGRTRTNKLVFFEDEGDRQGQLVPVRITWAGPWSLVGEPSDGTPQSVTSDVACEVVH
jgi:tRNA-2-methylthio-N6-dimethylallyladenosine synthase